MRRPLVAYVIGMACLTVGGVVRGQGHAELQAVNTDGVSTNALTYPFIIRGVLLNEPEEMLDSTWDAEAESTNTMGAQWQVFVQAVEAGDRGGTACWMGQNYNSIGPWIPEGNSYSEAQWSNEMYRLNHDANTGHRFRKGDLVDVTVNMTTFYGGKRNIAESHRTSEANDFHLSLVQPAHGLPEPEVIALADLVYPDDGNPSTHEDIFDHTRQSGGEHYQGMLVRLEGIRLATNCLGSAGWGKTVWGERLCTVTDGQGRYFNLRMPLTDLGPAPDDWFSAVGVLNQESGSGSDGTFGYELFVQEIGPTLTQVVIGGKVFTCWSGTYSNYVLQRTTNIADDGSWTNVTTLPRKLLAVEEDAVESGSCYRLMRKD